MTRAAVSRAEADWLVGINATNSVNVQIQRAAVLWACTDTDTCDDCKAGGRDSHIPAKEYYGVTVQAGKIKWTWQDQKLGSYPFIFKRTNRKAGRRFEWGNDGRGTGGKNLAEEIICAGII